MNNWMITLWRRLIFPLQWKYVMHILDSSQSAILFPLIVSIYFKRDEFRASYIATGKLRASVIDHLKGDGEKMIEDFVRNIAKSRKRTLMIKAMTDKEFYIYSNRTKRWREHLMYNDLDKKLEKSYHEEGK